MSEAEPEQTFAGARYSATRNSLIDAEGKLIALRPKTLAVFRTLAERADCVVDKDEMFELVWAGQAVSDDSLVQCVADIRRALGEHGRETLRTVPGRGYLLASDEEPVVSDGPVQPEATGSTVAPNERAKTKAGDRKRSVSHRRPVAIGLVVLFGLVLVLWHSLSPKEDEANAALPSEPVVAASNVATARDAPPSVAVSTGSDKASAMDLARVVRETRLALGRYRSVALQDIANDDADFVVRLSPGPFGHGLAGIIVEIVDTAQGRVLANEALSTPKGDSEAPTTGMPEAEMGELARALGVRVAALVASPGGGVIGRHLLEASRSKPVAALTRSECYAYGYGCTTCSGELESITPRAEACLANALRDDPTDARSWALLLVTGMRAWR